MRLIKQSDSLGALEARRDNLGQRFLNLDTKRSGFIPGSGPVHVEGGPAQAWFTRLRLRTIPREKRILQTPLGVAWANSPDRMEEWALGQRFIWKSITLGRFCVFWQRGWGWR